MSINRPRTAESKEPDRSGYEDTHSSSMRSSSAKARIPSSPNARKIDSPTAGFWAAGSPLYEEDISNEMLDAKMTRKKAETDLLLLANRISLLKVEEQKALHKVIETKERAEEILKIKKRNEDQLHERIRVNLAREHQIREIQIVTQSKKRELHEKLMTSLKFQTDNRKANAEEVKEEKRKLEQIRRQGRTLTEMEKQSKALEIKQQKEAAIQQRERQRLEREHKQQQAYLQRIADEAKKKRMADDMINQLEREERELINRLRKTQRLQEKAYSSLKESLRA